MNRALPWNVGKVDFDPRKAARDAAQRQGKSLGEWLHGVIADHAADIGVDERDMGGAQRIHAVTSRLERLNVRGDASNRSEPEPDTAHTSGLHTGAQTAGNEARDGERRPRVMRADTRRRTLREDARSDREGPATTESLLEDAIAAMEERAQRAEQHADNALMSVTRLIERTEAERERERDSMNVLAQKLTDIEARLKNRFADSDDVPIQGAIARLEARIDTIGRPSPALRESLTARRTTPPSPAPRAAAGSSRYQSRLQEKLETILHGPATPAVPPPSPRPASSAAGKGRPFSRLQEKLESIIEPPASAMMPPPWTQDAPPAPPSRDERLAAALAEIARRQRALDDEPAPASGPSPLMRRLQTPAPRAPRQEVPTDATHFAAIQTEIASLASTVENLRRDIVSQRVVRQQIGDPTPLFEQIELVTDVLHGLESRGGFDGLDSYVDAILTGIADARDFGRDEAVYRQVENVLESLRHAMPRLDTRTLARSLRQDVRTFAIRVEEAAEAGIETAVVTRLHDAVSRIAERLTKQSARPLAAERIAEQVKTLAARLGRRNRQSKAPPDLAAYVEELHILIGQSTDVTSLQKIKADLADLPGQLTETAGGLVAYASPAPVAVDVPGVRTLEVMVRDLSEKFDAAHRNDPHALDALQDQVAALLNRFDRTENDFSKITVIEQSMRDLFNLIEEQRDTVSDVAGEAAREALRLAGKDAPVRAERDLEEVVAERTSATLSAVHGTLEKVVERLTVLESGMASGRAASAFDGRPRDPKAADGKPAETAYRPAAERPAAPQPEERTATARPDTEENRRAAEARVEPRFQMPPKGDSPDRLAFEDKPLGAKAGPAAGAAKAAPAKDTSEAESGDKRADFIAAARRAAQAAQASVAEREQAIRANKERVTALGAERLTKGKTQNRASLIQQSRSFVSQQKRPVLLGLAALCVVAGTMTIIRMSNTDEGEAIASAPKTTNVADNSVSAASQTTTTSGAIETNPAQPGFNTLLGKPVVGTSATPANKVAGIDPIQTGSVPNLPSFAAGTPAPQAGVPVSLKTMADAGYAAAQYTMGVEYADGNGVARDFARAAQWYQKAADQGLAPAQYRLASLYEKGLGVTQDKDKARALYQKAAEAGNPRAMHNLAVLLADGDGKPDYEGASAWFRRAAEYGIRDSQYNLAILLARGIGVKQSFMQSYQWFAIAAAQGDTDAAKKRDEVGTKLRQSDIDVATALAGAFHPRTADKAAIEVTPPPGGWDSVQAGSPLNSPRPKISSL